jgi:hypothetical protein
MFQLIRELRILDERLAYYEGSRAEDKNRAQQAEVSLKGLWIDMVEGGAKNPGSVLGLSSQLGFTILPDLFFRTTRDPLKKIDDSEPDAEAQRAEDRTAKNNELADYIGELAYNEKVKEVLGRKLTQFYIWKDSTEKELTVRRSFMVKYFRQYYQTIKLYMSWVRPYLKLLRRLQIDISKTADPQLISAFEGSMIEIELLAKKSIGKNPFYSILLLTLEHATQPKLSFSAEGGFHRGPLHTGRTFITWRSYAWTNEDIAKYQAYRDTQDFELLASVDSTLRAALDSVEGEIKKYLKDLGEVFEKAVKKEEKKETLDLLEPIVAVVKGFWEPWEESRGTRDEYWGDFKTWWRERLSLEPKETEEKQQWGAAQKDAFKSAWTHYKLFKNANELLTW